ncbi:hypothetical protein [Streptomyces cinereoruber]|uniref:hypothetical protein n=1 Tax=Streptomyces cinereoruber TaxID=67260 RepID=UPI00345CD089
MTTEPRESTASRTVVPRLLGLLLVLVSVVPAAGCVLAFADWLPTGVARYEEYRTAERCAAAPAPGVWREDCLREVELDVVGTVVERRARNSDYQATVSGERFRGELDFGDPGPLLNTLRAGDRVVATVWRGDVVALAKDGLRQKTSEEPRDEPQMTAAGGTGLGLLALTGLAFGAVRLVAPRRLGPFTWRRSGRTLFFTNLGAAFGVGLVTVWTGLPWQVTTPAILAVVLGVGHFSLRAPAGSR